MSLIETFLREPARLVWFGRGGRGSGAGGVRFEPAAPRPAETVQGRYYLHVRSVAADGERHLLQFSLADDDGNVAVSAFARAPSPVGGPWTGEEGGPRSVDALEWDELEAALRPCRDAWVVAFGRRLHGGLLPASVREGIGKFDCARTRFLKVARRRGLRVPPGGLIDVNDARRLVGLAPVRSADAALRALALRELWLWMDGE